MGAIRQGPRGARGELTRGGVSGSIFRRFMYLDFDMAINALAFLEGGVAEQVSRKTGFEVGAGGKLTAKGWLLGDLELSANGSRSVGREVTLKRTAYAVIGILIDRLLEAGDLRWYRARPDGAGPRSPEPAAPPIWRCRAMGMSCGWTSAKTVPAGR